jgi:nucleotide-binding universal stress UspA family protein
MIESFKITQSHIGVGAGARTLIAPTFVRNHPMSKILRISSTPISSPHLRQHATLKSRLSVMTAANTASESSSTPKNNNASSRNIVIAVDTSPAAKAAATWVMKELIRPGDVVHLAHCIPPLPVSQGLYSLPDGRLAVVDFKKLLHNEKEYLKAAENVVSTWAWEIFHPEKQVHYVVDVIKEDEVLSGSKHEIARKLIKKAEELNACALVLCPHGHGGLGELLWGSVAADTARHSTDTPVVVLHEPSSRTAGKKKKPVVTWLSNLLVRELGHPDTVGTAAEVIAESAANGPLHLDRSGSNSKLNTADSSLSSSLSLSSTEEDINLIGQAVGELPGTDIDFSTLTNTSSLSDQQQQQHKGKEGGRTIVVAIDDSDASSRAASWAAHHLYIKGDKLHLVHIIPSLPSVAFGAGPMAGLESSFLYVLDPPTAAFKEATEKYLEERFHGTLRAAGVDFTSDILLEMTDGGVEGVGQALLTKAEELGASAVVVGSQHSGGLGEFLLGSVAQWLAHHSLKIPVVILH